MSAAVQDMHQIDTQASKLLSKILNGNMEQLSEQDRLLLIENKRAIIAHLNTVFSREIPLLLSGEACLDETELYWGLKLAEFFEAAETFLWVEKLCHLSIDDLEDCLGADFITEELAQILANTMNQWNLLKDVIENPDIDEFIRSACLDALIFAGAKKQIDRLEIIDYFKSLFHRILNGELDDRQLCTHLVSSCADFWPGECLEEIRESFGLFLVDTGHLNIDDVLEAFSEGKDYCIETLQTRVQKYKLWEAAPKFPVLSLEEQEQKFDQLTRLINQAKAKFDRDMEGVNKGSQRNELCRCGSRLKYKKCCLNKPSQVKSCKMMLEESALTYDPLEESEAMMAVPKEDKASIWALYSLIKDDPETVIHEAPKYISKHPDVPQTYNFLYSAYLTLGQDREAMKLMKKTIQLFPDYLFVRVEYAQYLLRRGEPEKAHEALGNAETLTQLYPERKIFHHSEWKAFAYVMCLHWIKRNNINQAEIYLGIIKIISPNDDLIKILKRKIGNKHFQEFLNSRP